VEYELRRELYQITQWKDDSVYRTESLGIAWFDQSVVDSNKPRETNLIYASVDNDEMNIRRKKGQRS
jgi:hypothetical protein